MQKMAHVVFNIYSYLIKRSNTSFTIFLISYMNIIYVTNIKFFFNSYVNRRSTDILWAIHIIINSIIEIAAFFSTVQIHF